MKILMLCMGNICRSPLAEGILRSKISPDHTVNSAGTISMHEGETPDYRAINVAKKHGIDISHQKANYFDKSYLKDYDKIFCMDLRNFEEAISAAETNEEREKISLLLEDACNYGEKIEVPDPYYGTEEDFEKVYKMLDKACTTIAEKYHLI